MRLTNQFQGEPEASGTFLPSEYVRSKRESKTNVVMLLLFGVVICLTVAAFMMTNRRWGEVKAQQESIAAEYEEEAVKIEQLKLLEQQREQMLEKARVVTALIDRAPRSVIMAELARELPAGLVLTRVTMDGKRIKEPPRAPDPSETKKVASLAAGAKGKKAEESEAPRVVPPPRFEHNFVIEGLATVNSDVADYFATLRESPLFEGATLRYIEEATVNEQEMRKFSIEMRLREDADAAALLALRDATEAERSDGAAVAAAASGGVGEGVAEEVSGAGEADSSAVAGVGESPLDEQE